MLKISHFLPSKRISNRDLETLGLSDNKIFEKTGIRDRFICSEGEFALDLAFNSAEKLFKTYNINRKNIDYLIYCTQSPDFIIPNNASILQTKLKLRNSIGAIDINQGCSGYIYGLSLAQGIILSGQANTVLIITADCWSKYINEKDKSTKLIFGDGASATLMDRSDTKRFEHFIFGTDGQGADNLCVKTSGLRFAHLRGHAIEWSDAAGNLRNDDYLFMNGPEIFNLLLGLSHLLCMIY